MFSTSLLMFPFYLYLVFLNFSTSAFSSLTVFKIVESVCLVNLPSALSQEQFLFIFFLRMSHTFVFLSTLYGFFGWKLDVWVLEYGNSRNQVLLPLCQHCWGGFVRLIDFCRLSLCQGSAWAVNLTWARASLAHHEIKGQAGGGRERTFISDKLENQKTVDCHPKKPVLRGTDLEMTYIRQTGLGRGLRSVRWWVTTERWVLLCSGSAERNIPEESKKTSVPSSPGTEGTGWTEDIDFLLTSHKSFFPHSYWLACLCAVRSIFPKHIVRIRWGGGGCGPGGWSSESSVQGWLLKAPARRSVRKRAVSKLLSCRRTSCCSAGRAQRLWSLCFPRLSCGYRHSFILIHGSFNFLFKVSNLRSSQTSSEPVKLGAPLL